VDEEDVGASSPMAVVAELLMVAHLDQLNSLRRLQKRKEVRNLPWTVNLNLRKLGRRLDLSLKLSPRLRLRRRRSPPSPRLLSW
jgi:hypothetical protein